MRILLLVIFIIAVSTSSSISQVNPYNHYVKPHIRSNGSYVQGYRKTNPNNTIRDNYSTYPNVNPYTGAVGTVKVRPNTYRSPSYSNRSYQNLYRQPAPKRRSY